MSIFQHCGTSHRQQEQEQPELQSESKRLWCMRNKIVFNEVLVSFSKVLEGVKTVSVGSTKCKWNAYEFKLTGHAFNKTRWVSDDLLMFRSYGSFA